VPLNGAYPPGDLKCERKSKMSQTQEGDGGPNFGGKRKTSLQGPGLKKKKLCLKKAPTRKNRKSKTG